MDKNSLVVVKGTQGFVTETDTFHPNKGYRCCEQHEGMIVYGVWFSKEDFLDKFEYAHDRVVRDLTEIGLIVDGKAISKSKFTQMGDFHKYGRTNPAYICFFRGKEILYGFYGMVGDTKKEMVDFVYSNLLEVIKGDVKYIDDEFVQFGDKGVPITYNNIRSWWRP